jgi:hypothetical protein
MPNVRSKGRETVGGLSEASESEDSNSDDSCDSEGGGSEEGASAERSESASELDVILSDPRGSLYLSPFVFLGERICVRVVVGILVALRCLHSSFSSSG